MTCCAPVAVIAMRPIDDVEPWPACSFCGVAQRQADLIVGPAAYICRSCVDTCRDALAEIDAVAPAEADAAMTQMQRVREALGRVLAAQRIDAAYQHSDEDGEGTLIVDSRSTVIGGPPRGYRCTVETRGDSVRIRSHDSWQAPEDETVEDVAP